MILQNRITLRKSYQTYDNNAVFSFLVTKPLFLEPFLVSASF